jgi:hypothetical protein
MLKIGELVEVRSSGSSYWYELVWLSSIPIQGVRYGMIVDRNGETMNLPLAKDEAGAPKRFIIAR